ncbi:MAG: pseudouridine synthase [Rhizobiales bacterium NRL2]|jgi:23S rRNA pseudouridine2605 synthase|nr:MAG: pseudouridine synthase [Rhizobiales bacterium NRL2]
MDDKERIAKRLARAGIASRREAERMIEAGRVKLNGQVLKSPAVNVGPDDTIEVDGKAVGEPDSIRLWRYHKPAGLLTTARDDLGRATIYDHLPKRLPRVVPVGRLDLNSEGLLLLTNDGGLKRGLELPGNAWTRTYRVRAYGAVKPELLEDLKRGITVDGEKFGAIEVTAERSGGRNTWLTVSLNEGRNREVRRALDAVGLTVNRLIRTAYGPFRLGELGSGQVVEVPGNELRRAARGLVDMPRTRDADRRR